MSKTDFNLKTLGPDFIKFWKALIKDVRNWRDWLRQVIRGAVLGTAVIGPGISGSALAVAFGIYDTIIRIIANPFKKFWGNLRYLAPLCVGGVLGVAVLALLLNHLFSSPTSAALVTYLFIGLMLGSLPAIIKEANSQGFKKSYLGIGISILIAFTAFGFWLITSAGGDFGLEINFFTAMLGGAIIGLVSLVPGLSVSFVLIFLGLYQPLMAAVTSLDVVAITGVMLGALVSVVLFAKLVKFLLGKYYGSTYYFFIGLAISAVILAWPPLLSGWLIAAEFALLAAGIVSGYFLNKLSNK